MTLSVRPYTEEWTGAVADFNRRLQAGGGSTLLSSSPRTNWPPRHSDRKLFGESFLAVDGQGTVRGGYMLKHQDFWIHGQVASIGCIGSPISEGLVDRAHAPLGVRLLLDAQQRQPLLYGLGMGGLNERLPQLLKAAGWPLFSVPFYFRIVHPVSFLRHTAYLRRSFLGRSLSDALAMTGAGWLGIRLLQACRLGPGIVQRNVDAEVVEEFADWADQVWEDSKDEYRFCAVRDAPTLRILYPADMTKFIRLRLRRAQRPIGWAVLLATACANHKQFGHVRLGSIADCFAHPGHARTVIAYATKTLEAAGVDLIVSNQSHHAWRGALRASGFLRGPSNFILATSRQLANRLECGARESRLDDLHVNRGDGDGPINL